MDVCKLRLWNNVLWVVVFFLTVWTGIVSADDPANLSSRDRTVLNVVLEDLLTYSGDDSPVKTVKGPPDKLFFSPDAEEWPQTVEQVLYRHTKEPWEKLTQQQLTLAQEAAGNLADRSKGHDFFTGFEPVDARVHLVPKKKPAESVENIYNRPIKAWSPGFSSNGTLAVVRLSIPWSIHSADGTYVLIREGDAWSILLRQFVFYV